MSAYTDAELVEFARIHDLDDPQSMLSRLEIVYATMLGRSALTCRHCNVELRPRPMPGTDWCIEHLHEPGCPEAD